MTVKPSESTWHVIVNPASGGGRHATLANRLRRALDAVRLDARMRTAASQAQVHEWISDGVATGARRFAVAGGDGTASGVLNALGSQPYVPLDAFTLAALPVGTGNDWARSLGVPRQIEAAVGLLATGRVEFHDIGVLFCRHEGRERKRFFLNMAGAGLDAHVVRSTAAHRSSRWSYFAALVREAGSFAATDLTVSAPHFEHRGATLVAIASLGRYAGGGMRIAPHARPDDGLLDVTCVAAMSAAAVLAHVPRLLLGNLAGSSRVSTTQAAALTIDGDAEIEADGELVGNLPARLSVLPRAVGVVTGRRARDQ